MKWRHASIGIVLVASGCAGTVIVDFSLAPEVTGHDASGRPWRAPASRIEAVHPSPGMKVALPTARFRGERFEWTFGTGASGLGGGIVNVGAQRLCFRFDEARVRSSHREQDQPLSVSSWTANVDGRWSQLGSTRPEERRFFQPPPLCLDPGARATLSFAPDLEGLFPSRKMFNVRFAEDGAARLVESGVGNWIALSLPIEVGAAREALQVKLTATDARPRRSGY